MAPTGINRPGYSSSRAPTGTNRPGYSSPKAPTGVNRPGTSSPNFSGYSRPSNRPTTPGSGYTPGGDSFQNYSQKDQATMFRQAGGRDNFLQQAMALQDKYPRSLDYQKFLDRSKLYQTGQILGGREVVGPDGIMRLQMAGADTPIRDAQGRQILSMMAPELTAQAPTMSQLMGDIGRGAGSMLSGIAKLPGQALEMYKQISPLSFILNQFKGASQAPITAQVPGDNMMQTSNPMSNLTEFGQMLANRIRTDRPGISDAELMQVLQRSNDAGFATQGRPVFKTGMFANGGIATLN